MTEVDFEKYWLSKFFHCLRRMAGDDIRNEIMKGSEEFSENSPRERIIQWTQQAMAKLDARVDKKKERDNDWLCLSISEIGPAGN